MGRPKRSDEAGVIYHMLNRANRRATIFHKDEDYQAFEAILAEALERSPELELFSYCLSGVKGAGVKGVRYLFG